MAYSLQDTINNFDPDLWSAMNKEMQRQEDHLELIRKTMQVHRYCKHRDRF